MRNNSFLFWLLLFVDGVFAADKVTVSVMVGDSVTLRIDDTETQGALELVWKIQGENKFLAEIDKEMSTTKVPGNEEGPFRGRLKLDDQTGSLTITNLNTTDSRVYELQIKTSKETKYKIFSAVVYGIFSFDGVKKMSVREGDSVTLQTRITDIPGDDVIEWTFGPQNTSIVKTDREKQILIYNEHDVRFTNKLDLNIKTGDLDISNIKTENSGLYQIKIIKSTYTIQKRFSVTVSVSGLSLGAVIGIVVAGLLVVVAAIAGVIVMICKFNNPSYAQASQRNAADP